MGLPAARLVAQLCVTLTLGCGSRDVVLSADQDPFFNTHMYSSFGELGVAVKTIMEESQGERKMHDNITSIDDMQRFVENFPELRKKSHTVGKHVALMTQLVQQVDSTGTRVMGERARH